MKYLFLAFLFYHSIFRIEAQPITPVEIESAYQYLNLNRNSSIDSLLKKCTSVIQNLSTFNSLSLEQKTGMQLLAGELNFQKERYDLALRYTISAQSLFQLNYPGKTHYWILTQLGKMYYHRGNYLIAGQNFSEALRTEEVKILPKLEDYIRDYILRIYNAQPSFSLTEQFFEKSIDIKTKLGDDKGVMMVTQKLVQVYYNEGSYQKCLATANLGINLAQKLKDPDIEFSNTIDKINCLIRLNKTDNAKTELETLAKKFNPKDFHRISKLETAWGNYFLALKNEPEALKHYQEALPNRAGPVLEQYVLKNQAESYEHAGMLYKSITTQKKYIKQLNEAYVSTVLPVVIGLEEQSAKKNLNDQIKYLNAQNQLKDTLFQNQKLLASALELKNNVQQEQLKNQLALAEAMQREMNLQKKQTANERKMSILFALSSIALLSLGTWVYTLYHKQKNKSKIIEQKSAENEMLMKEVHHRVKNNLQIISSLLDMQSMSIKDPTAFEAIKDGKNRVQSMALIHQNLYHDGNIRSIKIDDYIRHLAQSLFDSYHIDHQKIKLITDIEPLQLDVDTVVPLGIIINELITNTIKYAFQSTEKGEVFISLHKIGQDALKFQLKDTGKGFPDGWTTDSNHSFGYQLIKAFAKKLKAKINVYNDPGAVIDLHIYKYKTA